MAQRIKPSVGDNKSGAQAQHVLRARLALATLRFFPVEPCRNAATSLPHLVHHAQLLFDDVRVERGLRESGVVVIEEERRTVLLDHAG